jgi:hypothetical protein
MEDESITTVKLTMNRGEPFLNLFYRVLLKLYGIIVAFTIEQSEAHEADILFPLRTSQKYFLTILASYFQENIQI